MKAFVVILVALLAHSSLLAQDCQRVKLANTTQKKLLLREYINDCKQKHYFFNGQGAVLLVAYQDAEGVARWRLSAIVTDSYRTLVPEQYALLGDDVILVYKGDKNGNLLPIPGDTLKRAACIREVLGSRVAKRPRSNEQQVVSVREPNGKERKVLVTRVVGGNSDNSLLILFNKDGTLTKLIPV